MQHSSQTRAPTVRGHPNKEDLKLVDLMTSAMSEYGHKKLEVYVRRFMLKGDIIWLNRFERWPKLHERTRMGLYEVTQFKASFIEVTSLAWPPAVTTLRSSDE